MTLKINHMVMVAIVLGFDSYVEGISIDGQLTVIKNDCYERMAIGEKLSPKQTYKTFEHNTVSKCEMECTRERDGCRAYSFGIGPKGNASCLLSRNPVKETADLKPIGTISDTDYDLYIKKLDCHVVVGPPQPPGTQAPVVQDFGVSPSLQPNGNQNQQSGYGVQDHHHGHEDQSGHYGNVPAQSNYHSSVSSPVQDSRPPGYHYDKPNNSNMRPPTESSSNDGLHHVQTIVSIASGPQSVLHPVHDILVSPDSYGQGKPPLSPSNGAGYGESNGNLPPFRPPALNHPYNDDKRPLPPQHFESHRKPNQGYGSLSSFGYGSGHGNQEYLNDNKQHTDDFHQLYRPNLARPYPNDDRPDPDYAARPPKIPDYRYGSGGTHLIDRRKYESFNSFQSEVHRYGSEHPKQYNPNYNFYDHYDKRTPNYPHRYGSVIPHPNDYNRPDNDYLFVRPNSESYKPLSDSDSHYDNHRPLEPADHGRPDRPPRPEYGTNGAPLRPRPPYDSGYDRPDGSDKRPGYDERRPSISGYKQPEEFFGRPDYERPGGSQRPGPGFDDERPLNGASQGYDKPPRPFQNWNKSPTNAYNTPTSPYPNKRPGETSTSRPPSTELSNHYGGVDYTNKQYGKPGEYLNEKGDRRIVTESVGYHGEKITSIITELPNACFRRTLAGKRVVRSLVRKLLICDTVEQCQHECGNERRFTCEGFNYRLDPTGRGKGECELLDLPLSKIEFTREVVTDPDYDFYTRDRNAAQVNCRQPAGNSYLPHGGGGYRYDYDDGGNRRVDGDRRPFDGRPTDIGRPLRRPGDRWDEDYGNPRPRPIDQRPPPEDDRRPPLDDHRRPLPDDHRRFPPDDHRRPLPDDHRRPLPDDHRRPLPDDHRRPLPDDHRRPPLEDQRRPPPEDERRPDYENRRGDYPFHHSHESHSSHSHSYHYNEHNVDMYDYHQHEDPRPYSGIHYLPASPSRRHPYDTHRLDDWYPPPKRYPVIIPLDDKYPSNPLPSAGYPPNMYRVDRYHGDKVSEKDHWGLNRQNWGLYGGQYGDRYRYESYRPNYYIPSRPEKPEIPQDWGLYGGSYGTGLSLEYQGYGNRESYNYWGLNRFGGNRGSSSYRPNLLPPRKPGGYLPIEKPRPYLPLPGPNDGGYLPPSPGEYEITDNSILPAEPRRPTSFNFLRDECSLRSATGFRLHKGVVKKLFSVPNIYECELLCVREKEFPCYSYAFRYTITLSPLTDNCYLSNRNYKELDYYTDLEPDRNFDIYTMNNRRRCEEPLVALERKDSDCFWRVRSGQRLDHSVVRDSLTVKTIVDCQLECLQSRRFTCRAYSFRYGSPIIGGAIDNCQLTDWPFYELDARIHFITEREFEVYERGSYGHGCEPNHFGIRGRLPVKDNGIKVDQLCYIGFGTAAKLLPQATIKSVLVPTELDCKIECSKAREGTLFRCMSFSFVTDGPKIGHNCFLSDIMQRDLLPNVDYVHDPDSWLFTWDNYNPECANLAYEPLHNGGYDKGIGHVGKDGYDYKNPLDVWRVYSVSGWPCKRGTFCKENREAGFWYCELEGGEKNGWDYCCSPDHHCGFSNGYPYSWCYVGPSRTQWRKCNDQYYPYVHNTLDRFDSNNKRPWHTSGQFPPPPQTAGYRPDRPNAPDRPAPPRPSLDQYEQDFDQAFLSPPKPGGFGQPRRWPVAYLHKEMPPNATDSRTTRTDKPENTKLAAIKSLINVIQNTEIDNVQYHISNDSSKPDDVLYVKIPLPNLEDESQKTTTERASKKSNELSSNTKVNFEVVDQKGSRTQKSLSSQTTRGNTEFSTQVNRGIAPEYLKNGWKPPTFRRGFVTRTNLTSTRRYGSS